MLLKTRDNHHMNATRKVTTVGSKSFWLIHTKSLCSLWIRISLPVRWGYVWFSTFHLSLFLFFFFSKFQGPAHFVFSVALSPLFLLISFLSAVLLSLAASASSLSVSPPSIFFLLSAISDLQRNFLHPHATPPLSPNWGEDGDDS